MGEPRVVLENVTKRFGAIAAVCEASVQFDAGQIHALVGENGAGKSTLLHIAAGLHAPDSGSVRVGTQPFDHPSPRAALERGIGLVHQHFMSVEAFSALDNILLGAEPTLTMGRLDIGRARALALACMKRVGLDVDLDACVSSLGVGERQTIEIIRVLVRGARTILLDEPTAVLSPAQVTRLFSVLRKLADDGAAVVVVSHRIVEVMEHCDCVTVMRKGRTIAGYLVSDTSAGQIATDIMGQEPPAPIDRPQTPQSDRVVLGVEGLWVAAVTGERRALEDVSLAVHEGRIVGVAGVEGNGQHELVHALAGLCPVSRGRVRVGDAEVTGFAPARRREVGLFVVHADRHREGLMLDASVGDNLVLGDLGKVDEVSAIGRRLEKFQIVPADARACVRKLSGGNQQKVVMARALDRDLRAVVLAHPTRGVDLGAARAIHEAICETARRGVGVLVFSADLAELRALCHEVLVMVRGRIVARMTPDCTEDQFGRAMLGLGGSGAPSIV